VADRQIARATFASRKWNEAAKTLEAALGVHIAVLAEDLGSPLASGGAVAVCDADREPGATCIVRVEEDGDPARGRPIHAVCSGGLPMVVHPVVVSGRVVAHVMVYGFVYSDADRAWISRRLASIGVARPAEAAAGLTVLDRARADAAAHVVAGNAARVVGGASEELSSFGRQIEVSLLADVARGLGPAGLAYDRVPADTLATLLRLTGATCGRILLGAADGTGRRVIAEVGDCHRLLSLRQADEAVAHVLATGRTFTFTDPAGPSARTSVLTVPLLRRGDPAGALMVVKTSRETLAADDVRLVELFAGVVSAMLDNAADFIDANTKLVEMIQLSEVSRAFNSTLDLGDLAELAVQVLAKTLEFDVGGFVIDSFGEMRGRILHTETVGPEEIAKVYSEATGSSESELPAGVTVAACVAEPGGGTTTAEAGWTVLTRDLCFHNVRSGVLFVASSRPGALTGEDERVLELLAAHLAVALENSALYERLQKDFTRAIAALSAMADATERLESGHTDRVMDYAVAIGRAMDLSLERVGLLRFAGLLHDLGKVGIAEDILIKPASLTDAEMARVRRHSEVGASIVEQVRTLEELTPVVRHHHERWDGGGYPDGLAGEDIPLEARILAVADSYEAMTGRRTHRKRLAPATARAELERGAGTQFDPQVVHIFLEELDRRALGASTGAYAVAEQGPRLPA
jgi:HD-GYP domain-containing protein (c-di-GMP phosphodiesterase class II)